MKLIAKQDMKFPMVSLEPVTIAGVKYAPGTTFDAKTQESRDYLVKREKAKDDSKSPIESRVVEGFTPERKTDSAEKLDTPETVQHAEDEQPSATQKEGTQNGIEQPKTRAKRRR